MASSNPDSRKATVWVAVFAMSDDDESPDPMEMLAPAVEWLRARGIVPPDWQPPPSPPAAVNNPDGRATFVFASIAAEVPLHRALAAALDPIKEPTLNVPCLPKEW